MRHLIALCLCLAGLTGCVGKELDEMKAKVERQDARLAEMEKKQRAQDKLVAGMVALAEQIEALTKKALDAMGRAGR